ncbi:hypothetical protein [Marinobacterium sp. BA1]|uniref:hypothetical protein n=1 Tax=Marinobacterium sp. BA1 TaxID=3138931 RepID=UPI0032E7F14D
MTIAHTQHDLREERRRQLREAIAASNSQTSQEIAPDRTCHESERVQYPTDDSQSAQTSSLQAAASEKHMRILEDVAAGKAGSSSVRCIPQGNEHVTGRCLFHYTVTTITDESFSGTFTIDVHYPYRLISQSQSLGGMYQRVILTQTYPTKASTSGDDPSVLGCSVDLINLELDFNTARLFYKDVATQMDAAAQGTLEALKPPVKEVPSSSSAAEAPPKNTPRSTAEESDDQQSTNDTSASHAEEHSVAHTPQKKHNKTSADGVSREQQPARSESRQPKRTERDEGKRPSTNPPPPEQPDNRMPLSTKALMLTGGALLAVMIALLIWMILLKTNPALLPPQSQAQPMAPIAEPHTLNGTQNSEEDTLWQPN